MTVDLSAMTPLTDSELAAVDRRLVRSVDLDFFGAAVRVHVATAREQAQWEDFFKYHRADRHSDIDVDVYLASGREETTFFESIVAKDGVPKAIFVRADGVLRLWSSFRTWSSAPTPLPPFSLPPLDERVAILQASAVARPDGAGAVLFLAPPYQGKSTLANTFIAAGSQPLADNTTVVHATTEPLVAPYLTPSGIREESVGLLPELEPAEEMARPEHVTVSEVTGRVFLVHFDALHASNVIMAPCPPRLLVFLNDDSSLGEDFVIDAIDEDVVRARLDELTASSSRATARSLVIDGLASKPAVQVTYNLQLVDLHRVRADLCKIG